MYVYDLIRRLETHIELATVLSGSPRCLDLGSMLRSDLAYTSFPFVTPDLSVGLHLGILLFKIFQFYSNCYNPTCIRFSI
jgi:hypothetical protein